MLQDGYTRSTVGEVASRELRNNTASVIDRVVGGEDVVITVRGKPVARLVPLTAPARRRWMPADELARVLATSRADPGLRDDLKRLAGETTDDLGPPR